MHKEFTKEDLDFCLNELAKEFKKITHRKSEAEILLVGGASVLVNYAFRNMTTDFDAYIHAPSAMKDAMNKIRDKLDLPDDWLNDDFKKTNSYTPRLLEHAKYYRSFANVLTVRTISAEYLIAMKLQSGRKYKHDLSDIVGILMEHQQTGHAIAIEKIKTAYEQLYGDWINLPEELRSFILHMAQCESLHNKYEEISQKEALLKSSIIDFEKKYPNNLTRQNENEIISLLERRVQSQILRKSNGEKEQTILPSFIALCGIPGSGKSSEAEKLAQTIPNAKIVSLSHIRYINQELHEEPDLNVAINAVKKQIHDSLKSGRTVIYDASNITKEHRLQWLSLVEGCGVSKKTLIVMHADVETALSNCLEHGNPILPEKMQEKHDELQHNYPDVSEGWDEVKIVRVPVRKMTKEQLKLIGGSYSASQGHDESYDGH